MDATTVQEIANQLGIGIDQVLQYLPAYAQAQIMGWVIPIIVGILIFIVSAIIVPISYKHYKKYNHLYWHESDKKLETTYHTQSIIYSAVCIVFGVIGGIVLLSLLFAIPSCFGPIIGWQTSPELMLLQSLVG